MTYVNLIAIYFQGNEYLLDPVFAEKAGIFEGYQVITETDLIAILSRERDYRTAAA
ncbi:hypothetical protein [Larkinella arboricola]